ncbi:hypothetical protein V8E53_009073 [Lactarius tabidus]
MYASVVAILRLAASAVSPALYIPTIYAFVLSITDPASHSPYITRDLAGIDSECTADPTLGFCRDGNGPAERID